MKKTIYDLDLSLLTPLHIGSGETLLQDFDYALHQKRTWVIHQERLADYLLTANDGRFDRLVNGMPPARLLEANDFDNRPLFRYIMPGLPHRGATGVEIAVHIKDVTDRAYIPGSSLKGALRTALFRQAFEAAGKPIETLQPNILERTNKKRTGKPLEQKLLATRQGGRAPNYDLLRALQVTDSTPAKKRALFLAKARVFGHTKVGAPINLECLRADTTLQTTLTLDNYLFEDAQAQQKLNFGSQPKAWLSGLGGLINAQTQERIAQERAFYQQREPSQAGQFYDQLHDLTQQMPANRFLIQVGWGGGWDSKTLSYLLPRHTKDNVVVEYGLARNGFTPGHTHFPRTRRALGRGLDEQTQPVLPLGWILVEMKQR